jgi:hypothetical protein
MGVDPNSTAMRSIARTRTTAILSRHSPDCREAACLFPALGLFNGFIVSSFLSPAALVARIADPERDEEPRRGKSPPPDSDPFSDAELDENLSCLSRTITVAHLRLGKTPTTDCTDETDDWNDSECCFRSNLANTTILISMSEAYPCYPRNPWSSPTRASFVDLPGNVCFLDAPGRVLFVPSRSFRSQR